MRVRPRPRRASGSWAFRPVPGTPNRCGCGTTAPLMLYGATRVGNGQGGGPKGGCLVEMNPPGGHFDESIGAMLPFRKVLDNRTQAWCVMPVDAKPASACVTAPR